MFVGNFSFSNSSFKIRWWSKLLSSYYISTCNIYWSQR